MPAAGLGLWDRIGPARASAVAARLIGSFHASYHPIDDRPVFDEKRCDGVEYDRQAESALDLIETAAVLEPRRLRDGAGNRIEQASPVQGTPEL